MVHEVSSAPPRRHAAWRFSKYSMLSFITVPTGFTLLLVARHFLPVNAGLLNLAVGTVLTPPSFLLYRTVVWREGSAKGWRSEMFTFWQTVMLGGLAATALIAGVDAIFGNNGVLIVTAGLVGQGIVFVGRFLWLDKVTYAKKPPAEVQVADVAAG